MPQPDNLEDLLLAERHVRRGREIVARQRDLIAALRAESFNTASAEDLLSVFEDSLAIFEEDLAALRTRR